jgi:hypothetical protein
MKEGGIDILFSLLEIDDETLQEEIASIFFNLAQEGN